ncbi:MAG: 50S ribosomal protein L27 [Legionellales bacterium]|nr:50S ribosomal protein L27 [Legionellales bacterium]
MAHKKAGGSSCNGRDSNPKYRGVKVYGGEIVLAGNIIVRQVGNKYHAGKNVGVGKDYTLYALIPGVVAYCRRGKHKRRFIDILPAQQNEVAEAA